MNYYVITRHMTKEVDTTNTSFSGVKRMSTKRRGKPPFDKERFKDRVIRLWNNYWSRTHEKPREIELIVKDAWMKELDAHIKEMLDKFGAELAKRHLWILRVILAFGLLGVPLNLSDAEWLYKELCDLGFNPVCYQNRTRKDRFVILLGGDDTPSGYEEYSLT